MSDWILVVDDDTSNLKMASRILSWEKMRVSCMKSGEDAVKFLKENRPDLILLDVHMPGMDLKPLTRYGKIKRQLTFHSFFLRQMMTAILRQRGWQLERWILLRSHLFQRCFCSV